MLSLKRSVLISIVLLVGFVSGLVFSTYTPATQAQDGGMEGITCDSTLVILLYVAEHDYGFHSMLDVSQLDKGQYAPLFDAMMADMGDDMSMEATEEADMSMEEDDMMDEDTEMMEGMTMLTPGSISGEDAFCTELRAELDSFFYETFTHNMMTEESSIE